MRAGFVVVGRVGLQQVPIMPLAKHNGMVEHFLGTLGMNIGYHRLLTHRGFSCPRWLERLFAILGVCCAEESPIVWVAWHRQHHSEADKEPDPHSPLASFLWGHIGWLIIKSDNSES